MEQFVITKDWIFNNRTKRGAWTKEQINAIGLKWPATSGWVDSVVGLAISSHDARRFEEGSTKTKKAANKEAKSKMSIDSSIEFLFKKAQKLDQNQLVRLRNVESKYLDKARRK